MNMIKQLSLAAALVALCAVGARADSWTILDEYHGADPTNGAEVDRIGSIDFFDVEKMVITTAPGASGDDLTIDIHSTFFNNIGKYGAQVGDLFISTNGWTPYGSAPYDDDFAANGTDWEYAVKLNGLTGAPDSGSTGIYIVDDTKIKLSDDYFGSSGLLYRAGQEVVLDTSDTTLTPKAGDVDYAFMPAGDPAVLRITIEDYQSILGAGVEDLAFHWTMTCANDVVEGIIPEPITVGLASAGLGLGLLVRRRRRR